jgi:pimeloyl-ACP methyl ester carboxylesterase
VSLDNSPTAVPADVAQWRSGGRFVSTQFGSVFTRATAGTGPTLLFLHGLPTSSYDWRTVVARLAGRSTLTLDFPGFGLSGNPSERIGSPIEQADVVERVVLSHGIDRLVIVAHDTGVAVASELMARDMAGQLCFRLDRVVLSNGALRGSVAGPTAHRGPTLSVLTGRGLPGRVRRALSAFVRPRKLVVVGPCGGTVDDVADRGRHTQRWRHAVSDWPKPIGLLWGLLGPGTDAGELGDLLALRPSASVRRLADLGHSPQLEDAERYVAALVELC